MFSNLGKLFDLAISRQSGNWISQIPVAEGLQAAKFSNPRSHG
jgi:hypothetical protein